MKTTKVAKELEISYPTSDNILISGLLTIPLKVKRPPVVILAHGFCGNKDENGFFVQAAKSFYKHGYAVLRFDFRGCGNSSGEFKTVRLKDTMLDLLATVNYIKSQRKILDAENIAFVGFSLGATLGLLADIPEFKTLAFWSPAFFPCNDMYPRYIKDDVISNEIDEHGYFVKSNLKVSKLFLEDLANCDTSEQIDKFDKPVLVIHGKKDERINWQSTEFAFSRMKQNDNHSPKFIQYIDDGHSFKGKVKNRSVVIKSTINWFDFYLKPNNKLFNSNSSNASHGFVNHKNDAKQVARFSTKSKGDVHLLSESHVDPSSAVLVGKTTRHTLKEDRGKAFAHIVISDNKTNSNILIKKKAR